MVKFLRIIDLALLIYDFYTNLTVRIPIPPAYRRSCWLNKIHRILMGFSIFFCAITWQARVHQFIYLFYNVHSPKMFTII